MRIARMISPVHALGPGERVCLWMQGCPRRCPGCISPEMQPETGPQVPEKALADIVRIAKENSVGTIVVGLPRNMDGSEGPRAELCREFGALLGEATGLEIVMWDERRTTVEAHNILSQHNYHGQKRKNTVDAVAAALILEGYLNSLKR